MCWDASNSIVREKGSELGYWDLEIFRFKAKIEKCDDSDWVDF